MKVTDSASRARLHRALDAAMDAKAKDVLDPTEKLMLTRRLAEARQMVKRSTGENREYWAKRINEIQFKLEREDITA
jgi:hypothetical protein